MREGSPVSSSIPRKKVTGCAEVSTFGADNLSKLSLIQNRSVLCAVVWFGWVKPAPSRKERLVCRLYKDIDIELVIKLYEPDDILLGRVGRCSKKMALRFGVMIQFYFPRGKLRGGYVKNAKPPTS
jgi:hypothetical protein